jgi:hypothetical protein
VFNNIASATNTIVSKNIEAPIQKGIDWTTDKLNNNIITDTGFDFIESLNAPIQLNFNDEDENLTDYLVVRNKLKAGLMQMEQSTLEDKAKNNEINNILAIVNNTSEIKTATKEISDVENIAKKIIQKSQIENKEVQEKIKNYDNFIEDIKDNTISLVSQNEVSTKLTTPLFTIDNTSKHILQSQEDPMQSYLKLNQKMVDGYLSAINND